MTGNLRDDIPSRVLQLAVPVMAAGMLILVGLTGLMGFAAEWRRLPPIGIAGASALVAHVLRRAGRPRPGARVLLYGCLAAVATAMALNGGVPIAAYFGSIVFVVFAHSVFGPRHAILVIAILFVLGGVFTVLGGLHKIPAPKPLPDLVLWLMIVTFASMAAGFAAVPLQMMREAMEKARQDHERLREAQERLHQAEKMESLGKLAGGAAHDFNNALTGILVSAQLLERGNLGAEESRGMLKLIRESADRASQLTKSLLLFSRKASGEKRAVDLGGVVRSAASLLERTLDRRIRVASVAAEGSVAVLGQPGHLENAIINLGLNARDAMPTGGTLTITLRQVRLLGSEPGLRPASLPPGEYAAVEVRDTGHGIDRAHLDRIFEPFFTTKSPGQGTGLGLSSVLGTVIDHGGAVEVKTRAGAGSDFTLYLPFRPDLALAPQAPAAKPAPGTGHVLLVDDEAPLRDLGATILIQLGYTVETASSGEEALQKLRSRPGAFDLLLVDLSMPGMDGARLCEEVRAFDAAMPVVVVTGFLGEDVRRDLKRFGVTAILEKPYRIEELRGAVEESRRKPVAPVSGDARE